MPQDSRARLLLLDIGNTHCHAGLASPDRVLTHADLPTSDLVAARGLRGLERIIGRTSLSGVVMCSVVPKATREAVRMLRTRLGLTPFVLNAKTVSASGLELDYPRPETIGPDRLANAIAARHLVGVPSVVVDFGTAVTFDIVDKRGRYVGGIIAPGLASMTDYLHEKTALLPRIRIREVASSIGKSTEEAMLVGAVHGYRGLVRALIGELRNELNSPRLPVVATGGYAELMARGVKEITSVLPQLTLEGLRLFWLEQQQHSQQKPPRSRRPC